MAPHRVTILIGVVPIIDLVFAISTKKGICVSHLKPETEYKCQDLAAFSEDIWW